MIQGFSYVVWRHGYGTSCSESHEAETSRFRSGEVTVRHEPHDQHISRWSNKYSSPPKYHLQRAKLHAKHIYCTHERITPFQRRQWELGKIIERLGPWSDATKVTHLEIEHMLTCLSDGGGVRGLSSLLILEALLEKVKEHAQLEQSPPLNPHDVFQLVVGTSTGG